MLISKRSAYSGKVHTQLIHITEAQLSALKTSNRPIGEIVPHLSADDKEFLMTGITKSEWATLASLQLDEVDDKCGGDYADRTSSLAKGKK